MPNQGMVEFLNGSLPVHLTANDVHQYPELMKLLTALSDHITDQGITRDTHRQYMQAQDDLKSEKEIWLQNQILYTEIQDLLLDFEISKKDHAPSTASSQFHKIVQEALTMAEIADYSECNQNPDSGATLLGITKEELHRLNPHKKHIKSIQQKLIPDIEDRLRHKCETLVNFYEPILTTDSEQLTFAKSSQLPSFLEKDHLSLEMEKKHMVKDKNAREKQFRQYYQALVESLNILEELILKHRLQSQAETDEVRSEWLMARCDGMSLKIKLVEMQLLCDTYTADTVTTLQKIRHHLDVETHNKQVEHSQTSQALSAYESVGMGFDSLVQDYTKLNGEVENKRWALRELKRSLEK